MKLIRACLLINTKNCFHENKVLRVFIFLFPTFFDTQQVTTFCFHLNSKKNFICYGINENGEGV